MQIAFLSYLSRSGSTFLAALLDQFRDVHLTLEADVPLSMLGLTSRDVELRDRADVRRYLDVLYLDPKMKAWPFERADLAEQLEKVSLPLKPTHIFERMADLSREGRPASVVVFKGRRPSVSDFKAIQRSFTGSRMICLIRDPRGIHLSQSRAINAYNGLSMGWSARRFGKQWSSFARAALELNGADAFHLLKYEDLVSRSEEEVNRILEFLGCTRSHGPSASYASRIASEQRALHGRIQLGPDRDRLDLWKRALDDRAICSIERDAQAEMWDLGYETKFSGHAGLTEQRLGWFGFRSLICDLRKSIRGRLSRVSGMLRTSNSFRNSVLQRLRGW